MHNHDHGTVGHHHPAPSKFNSAFLIAVSLNFLFVVAEAIYAIMANSTSLLADAGHNLGDVLGLALAWGANWLLQRSSADRYTYGYRRTTILAAISNALLLVLTSAIIATEAIEKLMHPAIVNEKVVILVAAIGIVINGGTAALFVKGRKDDLNIKAAFMHLAADTLISVGVVIAGFVILSTGWYWFDPVVGLIIVISILIGTWSLLRESVDLILDAIPRHIDQQGVKRFLTQWPGVQTLHDLHIWGLSTKEVALTAHLIMPDQGLSDCDHQKINETLLNEFKIHHVTIQVEKSHSVNSCKLADKQF